MANSGLKPQEYSGPILGLIFLRYAEVRFALQRGKLDATGCAAPERRLIYAATSTYSTWLDGSGIGSPSSRIPARWSSMALRILRSTASTVAPVATQPGKSSTYAP